MTTSARSLGGKGKFARGVHPPENKSFAAEEAIEALPHPKKLAICLLQHTGAACDALVKPREEVQADQLIGDNDAFISAPVHSPLAGIAARLAATTLPNGRRVKTIPITASEGQPTPEEILQDVFGGDWPSDNLERYKPSDIADTARNAGLVGLGGAAFPTHVKLRPLPDKPIDTILLNGCECEPYLTADYRVMIEYPRAIITGAILAAIANGAKQVIIGIEDNKPKAIDALSEAAKGTIVKVVPLATRYPMGGEKQTILATLGRVIPTGKLPLDVGVVVVNVATAAALARAVLRGKPLTHRVVTVTGGGIAKPKNLLVAIGTCIGELIDACGGLNADASRVVAGGPMMGFALGDLKGVVTKGMSGLVVLTIQDVVKASETNCIRCGRCVDVCPLNLVPAKISLAARNKDWELAKRYHMAACMECGCCAYVCPASIPLVQLMRMGKAQMPRE